MMTNLLIRGLLVGLAAGILAFGSARIVGEPQVDRAVAFEAQLKHAQGEAPEPELVSRQTQAGIGLFTGIVAYGTALGGLFSLVFAFAYGRVGDLSPRATAALLALAGFLIIVVVPQLKYPANPPSVGDPETIGRRTALYFTMLAMSLAACLLAIGLARHLSLRLGAWSAVFLAILAFILAIAVVEYALPDVNEVPDRFSAVVLWRFRIASFGIQAVLWATLGIAFGIAAEKSLGVEQARRRKNRLAFR
jgi:Probable cobalt transporter subunit (CbtA)